MPLLPPFLSSSSAPFWSTFGGWIFYSFRLLCTAASELGGGWVVEVVRVGYGGCGEKEGSFYVF